MGIADWVKVAMRAAFCFICLGLQAQTLTNAALNGKFFFRHVSLAMDAAGNFTDARSLMGTMTFDGAGHYTLTGQQVIGNNASAALNGSGAYGVDPAGFVTMDNPQRTGVQINARVGPEALLGSSTESGDNTLDLFAAIPAPASTATAAFSGSYWTATLEYPGGTAANARSAIFNLSPGTGGTLATITVNGHAAGLSGGSPQKQQISGATDSINTDGTGTVNFGSSSALVSGGKTLYVSADGNLVLGGSTAAGSHDFLIGVKAVSAATAASWSGNFWAASLRTDASENPPALAWSGSVHANGAQGLTWTRRINALNQGSADLTLSGSYSLNADGSGSEPLIEMGLGAAGKAFVAIALDATDPSAFELDFGARMADMSGTGIFLNPQGVFNAASFAPAGNPISPGEFVTLYLTGLSVPVQTAAPPYPLSLGGVSVRINNEPAPLYFVGASGGAFQINALVPYEVQGSTASIVVQSGNTSSNTVTVPLAATAPGVYALNQSGAGPGAILHADYSVVNASKPAHAGETVLVFLTGMGTVTPAVQDGQAGGANPLSTSQNQVTVYVADEQCTVIYNGLAPGFPGLYQINVTLPPYLPASGPLPIAISTANAYHDQTTIAIQ